MAQALWPKWEKEQGSAWLMVQLDVWARTDVAGGIVRVEVYMLGALLASP